MTHGRLPLQAATCALLGSVLMAAAPPLSADLRLFVGHSVESWELSQFSPVQDAFEWTVERLGGEVLFRSTFTPEMLIHIDESVYGTVLQLVAYHEIELFCAGWEATCVDRPVALRANTTISGRSTFLEFLASVGGEVLSEAQYGGDTIYFYLLVPPNDIDAAESRAEVTWLQLDWGGSVPQDPESPQPLALGEGFPFAAWVSWFDGVRSGYAIPVHETRDAGAFWFFAPDNLEIFVKILDACTINNHYWVFLAGLTNLEVVVRIEAATQEGSATVTYRNELGTLFESVADVTALPCS